MRLLFAVPHYFDPDPRDQPRHGSLGPDPAPRVRALATTLASLQQLFGRPQCGIDIHQRTTVPANQRTATVADVVVCTTGDKHLPDQRKENAPGAEASGAAAITKDAPTHYFRMMKELALLGYFTSEIGYTKAMRYVESPGRFDPCTPYAKGEPAWASHA